MFLDFSEFRKFDTYPACKKKKVSEWFSKAKQKKTKLQNFQKNKSRTPRNRVTQKIGSNGS